MPDRASITHERLTTPWKSKNLVGGTPTDHAGLIKKV